MKQPSRLPIPESLAKSIMKSNTLHRREGSNTENKPSRQTLPAMHMKNNKLFIYIANH